MSEKKLIIVIDGCSKDYITIKNTPNLYKIAEQGFYTTIKSAIPSVTNVNHATILSGSFPEEHGVVGNYYYNKSTKEEGFIESSQHMKKDSIIDLYHALGKSTALLTVKGKVLEIFGDQADFKVNLQKPDSSLVAKLSLEEPPHVGSLDTYDWIFRACYQLIQAENPDLVYLTTNDYMMHNYGPETKEAQKVMSTIDQWIGLIYDLDPTREIYITADHGMNAKTTLIDMQKKLDNAGFNTYCLLPLKDRYLENHRYQEGGAVYVYVLEENQKQAIMEHIQKFDFVDGCFEKNEASKEFKLPEQGIGDLLVLSKKDVAFAELEAEELQVNTRTHGSLHEREIPMISVNARRQEQEYQYNKDIVRFILEDLN